MQQTHVLLSILQQRIAESGGWIPFDRYMQAALYEPGLGYYESADVFGAQGDFVTGPDLGPWLARGFADLVAWGWEAMGRPGAWSLMEQGGGSGTLLCAVLQELAGRGQPMPSRIVAVEASSHMRERQAQAYRAAGIQVEQASSLPDVDADDACIMFSNELPDAFPVRCLLKRRDALHERGVGWNGSGLTWVVDDEPLADPPWIDAALSQAWPDGYASEWSPHLASWQRDIARVVRHGLVFSLDYGFSQQEYYRPNRVDGTLMSHYRHQGSADVLVDPGRRDITAHVDFTALAHWGRKQGLQATAFMSQGAWLAQSPSVQAHIAALAGSSRIEDVKQMADAKRLLLPSGMGELFKLLIQRTDGVEKQATIPPYLGSFNRLRDIVPHAPSA